MKTGRDHVQNHAQCQNTRNLTKQPTNLGTTTRDKKDIKALTEGGTNVDITFQIADHITQPLGSVRRLCEAGNRVVFDDKSYIENKATGLKTPIQLRNGKT